MNKIYIATLLFLPFVNVFSQSLKIEYEVQFKSQKPKEIAGSEDFKKKIIETDNQPQKHILTYSDGNSVYESFPPPIIYDTKESDIVDVTKMYKNSYQIQSIKLFKFKDQPGAYSYKKTKNEEFYEYLIPIFNESKKLEGDDKILNYPCKIIEVVLSNHKKAKVWYTDELPIKTGPMSYFNFPGVVLRVETDFMTVTTKNIENISSNIELETMNKNLKVYEKAK